MAEATNGPEAGATPRPAPLDLGEAGRPGVLLVHGFASAPTDFGALPWALEEAGLRVAAPLLPGHGTDPADVDAVSAEDLAECVREAYAKLRSESEWVAVVGFSMGGALALQLARDAERPPDALVLAAPYFRIAHKWYYVLPAKTWNALLSPVLPYAPRSEFMIPINRKEGAKELFIYDAISTRFVKQLVRIGEDITSRPPERVPEDTLLIRGIEDSAASVSAMEKMADRLGLPDNARKVLPHSNHPIFVDHDREGAVQCVVDFMKESLKVERGS